MTIKEIINTHTYTVDRWLLDELDREDAEGTYSSRKNVDALALEKTLKKCGKLKTLEKVPTEQYQWRHDWAYTDHILIDLKRRPKQYNNYSISNIHKMKESKELNQLTHLVGYSQNIENDYKIGDVLTFKFEGILEIEEAISKVRTNDKGYMFLSKNCLLSEESVL